MCRMVCVLYWYVSVGGDYPIFPNFSQSQFWQKVGGNWEKLAENTDDFGHFSSIFHFCQFFPVPVLARTGWKLGKIGRKYLWFQSFFVIFHFCQFFPIFPSPSFGQKWVETGKNWVIPPHLGMPPGVTEAKIKIRLKGVQNSSKRRPKGGQRASKSAQKASKKRPKGVQKADKGRPKVPKRRPKSGQRRPKWMNQKLVTSTPSIILEKYQRTNNGNQ